MFLKYVPQVLCLVEAWALPGARRTSTDENGCKRSRLANREGLRTFLSPEGIICLKKAAELPAIICGRPLDRMRHGTYLRRSAKPSVLHEVKR